ncbi:MAG: F0F1 ATP synthase subunit A [Patescibacteria group bacterium]|nr:F0F1 ATP synthase subunit A [Patescibacteria group bacterium]
MNLDISLSPEILFNIFGIPISNAFFWSWVVTLFLLVGAFLIKRNLKMHPGKFQNIIEMLVGGAFDFVESMMGDKKRALRVFPLVFTMFFFIFFCNLLTFIPGQAAVTIKTAGGVVPLFRAIISDYSIVFVMTMVSVIVTQIVAVASMGPLRYVGKFFNFTSPLNFFLGLMDLVGELAKVMSLSFRLFGNIFAGEVLGAVMLFLFPFFLPLPFALLGLLTAVVQPFVFSVLTLVFISMAIQPEEAEA